MRRTEYWNEDTWETTRSYDKAYEWFLNDHDVSVFVNNEYRTTWFAK